MKLSAVILVSSINTVYVRNVASHQLVKLKCQLCLEITKLCVSKQS